VGCKQCHAADSFGILHHESIDTGGGTSSARVKNNDTEVQARQCSQERLQPWWGSRTAAAFAGALQTQCPGRRDSQLHPETPMPGAAKVDGKWRELALWHQRNRHEGSTTSTATTPHEKSKSRHRGGGL